MDNTPALKYPVDAQQIAEQVCRILMNGMQPIPEFAASPVPMKVAEKVLNMDSAQIRNRMEAGTLDIGIIFPSKKKRGTRSYRNAYISPKKFWEVTGYVWRGNSEEEG